MAEKSKQTKKQKLTAKAVREMQPKKRADLLAEKKKDLNDAKRSLSARELTNPRKVTQLRREIALIKTVQNEHEQTDNQESKEA